jgi:hypothetical protein
MNRVILLLALLSLAACSGPAGGGYQEPGAADYCRTHSGIGNCQ